MDKYMNEYKAAVESVSGCAVPRYVDTKPNGVCGLICALSIVFDIAFTLWMSESAPLLRTKMLNSSSLRGRVFALPPKWFVNWQASYYRQGW